MINNVDVIVELLAGNEGAVNAWRNDRCCEIARVRLQQLPHPAHMAAQPRRRAGHTNGPHDHIKLNKVLTKRVECVLTNIDIQQMPLCTVRTSAWHVI